MGGLIVTDADIGGEVVDLRTEDGVVTEIGPALRARPGDDRLAAAGGAVIPGLHDHHVHLRAAAVAAGSLDVGPSVVSDASAFANALRRRAAVVPPGGWVRAVGYHERVAGPLDRWRLDALVDDRPVRVQHRSGALWILNSAGLAALPLADGPADGVGRDSQGRPDGRLWRADDWLRAVLPRRTADLEALSRHLADLGVTGLTDADPHRTASDVDELAEACRTGLVRQHLHLMAPAELAPPPPGAAHQGRGGRVTLGAVKFLLDDDRLPELGTFVAAVRGAHRRGRPVAVHCVTRVQLVLALVALGEAGTRPGDRIEHAAVVPPELRLGLRRLGLTVVTQPNFVSERGDTYRAEVDPEDLPWLWPCRSLQADGIAVAAGTDAPFGRADPWAAMRAAVDRRTPDGDVLGAAERVTPEAALRLFLGSPARPGEARRVRTGAPADLCLLDGSLTDVLGRLDADLVAATVIDGAVVADRR